KMGLDFNEPRVDLDRLRQWKDQVVDKLAQGLAQLSKRRKVEYIQARVGFEDSHHVRLYDSESEISHISFKHAIIATGSRPIPLPDSEFKPGSRIMDSGGALTLEEIPEKLLVVGGSYVGVEMGSVYASLGSQVTLIEMTDRIMSGADKDLVEPLAERLEDLFENIHLNTKLVSAEEDDARVKVTLEGDVDEVIQTFDRVLVAIGRRPNSEDIGLENTKAEIDEHGFVLVDEQRRTGQKNIYAIGDVVGGIMLAHKAMYEGKVAAEVIAGEPSAFDARAIPAVVYTDPQLAWCGLTEESARRENRSVRISRFPWAASGRAASIGMARGITKIIVDLETERVLGMGIVGREAGEMISEGVLAVEMGALAEDLALSIHPHPTLSETEEEAAGAFLGSSTHILPREEEIGSEEQ
ncbi:MAG: NAD(P)/FAD-dependent oxidoreductase, partial [Deltaproteobacteria bacterium]|nr:NAD(P)/FAD-dependent oxidoreductase [Deltaproteobacteria bacterium]